MLSESPTAVKQAHNRYVQVYTLEKVLRLKKDQTTQTSFLDEAMAVRSRRLNQNEDVSLTQCMSVGIG